MATSLKELDRRVNGRVDVELRNIGHALNARLGGRGYAWLSHRTLTKVVLACGSGRGLDRIQDLVSMGEFFRVTARGRGQGKGRTLYFKGWANRRHIFRELEANKMPLAALHAAERCFERYAARVFFRRKNASQEKRQRVPTRDSKEERTGAIAPDRFILPPSGPPSPQPIPAQQASPPRRYTALGRHAEILRKLRAQQDAYRR